MTEDEEVESERAGRCVAEEGLMDMLGDDESKMWNTIHRVPGFGMARYAMVIRQLRGALSAEHPFLPYTWVLPGVVAPPSAARPTLVESRLAFNG